MSGITTHVLDTALGVPASGVGVLLAVRRGEGWRELSRGATDADGRIAAFPDAGPLEAATYRLRFETGEYFRSLGIDAFWPRVEVAFEIADPARHHHVPLLLSPFGYSTYRGS